MDIDATCNPEIDPKQASKTLATDHYKEISYNHNFTQILNPHLLYLLIHLHHGWKQLVCRSCLLVQLKEEKNRD
jgi:hypothetical protein